MFTSLLRGRGPMNSDQSILEDIGNDLDDVKTWNKIIASEKTDSGVRMTPKLALSQPGMWRGLNILACGVAKVPFDVLRINEDGTKTRDRKHFASDLIRGKANRCMTAFRFKSVMMFHKCFRGNGIAVIRRDNGARPLELLPADPTRFGVLVTKEGDVKYVIGSGKEARILDYYDVLHFRGLSWDGHMGIDVFELMKEPMGLGVAARKFGSRFFGKGANAGGFLITPAGLSDEAAKRLHKDFKKATSGLDNAFVTTLLEEGAKFQQTTIEPEKAQFLGTRQYETRELANIIGIQSHKIGDKEGQAYNSLEQENSSFIDDSLDPHLCIFEDEYTDKLLTEEEKKSGTHKVEANRKAVKRVDTKVETEDLNAQLNNGLLNENEVRSILNRPAYPNGQGNRFRIPANITYTDAVESKQTEETKSEVKNLVADRLQRMQEIEVSQLSKAAAKKGNFLDLTDKLYSDHAGKLQESLEPVLRVAVTLWPGLPSAAAIAAKWCKESKAGVLSAAECSAAELPQAVASLADGWGERCAKFVGELFGGNNAESQC